MSRRERTMNGREKIEAALSKDGTREIPAVICYEGSNCSARHCEERSDEAISTVAYVPRAGDCFATLAMTSSEVVS